MPQNTPSWAKGLPNYTLYDKYDVARSGLIDTAETPQDKKRLKQDLQKLRQEYLALKAAQAKAKPTPKATSKKVSNGSDTKPYNVKLMTPKELVGGKENKKPSTSRTPSKGTKTPMPKVEGTKTGTKKPMPKTLTGPAAVKAIQDRTSPSGVKKAEAGAKKAIDKKYPGLYKKSK